MGNVFIQSPQLLHGRNVYFNNYLFYDIYLSYLSLLENYFLKNKQTPYSDQPPKLFFYIERLYTSVSMDFLHYLKNWFVPQRGQQSQPHPLVNGGSDRASYEHWKGTVCQQSLRQWLFSQYELYAKGNQSGDSKINFLCCRITKGFTWHFDADRWSAEDFRYMFAYLRERATEIGYEDTRCQSSPEARSGSERNYFHRCMLRPETRNQHNRFGDILICLAEQDGMVHSLKFSASSCREPACACEKRFGELMGKLLQPTQT